MDKASIRTIWTRAGHACEYCRLPSWSVTESVSFEIDHIIPKKQLGPTTLSNLALACFHCNGRKGPSIAGFDRKNRNRLTALFHPRRHSWPRHFRFEGPVIVGRTATGRVTIEVLDMNNPDFVRIRQKLIDLDLFDDILF